ncbi:MAG TPA: hypothetical protein VFU72_09470 [Nitrolancea sp.]|nr:hypothetical protein [Nitrolancea sp.]
MTIDDHEETRPPEAAEARRAALGRQLRSLRWGAVVLGAAATAAFSGLALRQSSATAGTPAATVQQSQTSGAAAPSQSLFGMGTGSGSSAATQPGASATEGDGFGRDGRFRHRSSFGSSGGDDGSASSSDPFGGDSSSSSSSSSGGTSLAPAPAPSLGGRVHTRSASS